MIDKGMDARTARQPDNLDPQEVAIQKKLADSVLSTESSRSMVTELHNLQDKFFTDAFSELNNPQNILNKYKDLVQNLSEVSRSEIKNGSEYLEKLSIKDGVILAVNHLGLIKLTKIDNLNNRFSPGLKSFEPFPLRHAPFLPVAKKLGMELIESAVELPQPLFDIQKACKVLTIDAGGNERTNKLIEDTKKLLSSQRSAVVMYPEGGTSGKRNNGGPYDLDEFHTGIFVIAKSLGIPVLPVCQVFNPNGGIELSVLPPIQKEALESGDLKIIAAQTKSRMQEVLNSNTY